MTETTKSSASCECGALAMDIKGAPVIQLVCHCKDCRSFSGTPYVDLAFFYPAGCSAHGQSNSTTMKGSSGSDKTYYSCASCQTALYATVAVLNGAFAIRANLLAPFKFEPRLHIWTSEKADGVTIPAGITQSPSVPPKEILDTMLSSFWDKK